MSVSYTCPNPACGVTLKTANKLPPGKRVKCPKCNEQFVPEPEAPTPAAASAAAPSAAQGAGTFKFADDEPAKKPAASKPEAPKPAPPPPSKKPVDDEDEDEESIRRGYGVVKETEAELEQAEKNKVKFGEVSDKYKKSARGPAIAMLVMPVNLLTGAGLVGAVAGLALFVVGMWPIVFNDAPPGDEEVEEAIVTMLLGMIVFGWGAFLCFGASQMSELSSYMWAMSAAVLGIPLLVGIYALVMLQDPKVKAGFEETEGGPEDEDEDEEDEDEDDEEDEDDDEEDEEEDDEEEEARAKQKRKRRRQDDDDDE